MFSWICPKCGKEVPPSYAECPNCAPRIEEQRPARTEPPPAPPSAEAPRTRVEGPRAETVRHAQPEIPPVPAAPGSRTETVWPTVGPRQPSDGSGSHRWLFGLLIGAALVIVGLTAVVLLRSNSTREQAQPPATAMENPASSAGTAANPALKDVELAGFRIIEDAKQKPELRFVVVNHSAADLGEVKAKVDLRAATNDQSTEPVASFTFAVKLGPYESKELKVALATKLRAYEVPDWQRLRADISH